MNQMVIHLFVFYLLPKNGTSLMAWVCWGGIIEDNEGKASLHSHKCQKRWHLHGGRYCYKYKTSCRPTTRGANVRFKMQHPETPNPCGEIGTVILCPLQNPGGGEGGNLIK